MNIMKIFDCETVKFTDEEFEKGLDTFLVVRDYLEGNFYEIHETMNKNDFSFGDAASYYYLMYDCEVEPTNAGIEFLFDVAQRVYSDYEEYGEAMFDECGENESDSSLNTDYYNNKIYKEL
jgi:hypothetical protein